MKRYTRVPVTLYRIQARLPVSLRDFQTQRLKSRSSFDLKLDDNGLYLPMTGDVFHTPNGMSLRPAGENMLGILTAFKGEPRIYRFPEGMQLPDDLCLYHEHTDHYSLQTAVPIRLEEFNDKTTKLLKSLSSQSVKEFLDEWDELNDQNN